MGNFRLKLRFVCDIAEMSLKTNNQDFSAAAFGARTREFTFWAGVTGLVLSTIVYLSIFLSGDLILHYKISSPLYAAFLSVMVLSAYFEWRVKACTNFSIAAIFLVFWLSSYAEALQDHLTFVSTPLVLFVPLLLMMVLHHKLVFGLAAAQFGLVLHYSYTYGTPHYAPNWPSEEQLYASVSLASLSAICLIAVGIVSRLRSRTDKKLQSLVSNQSYLATTDALTGLPNRRGFTAKLNEMLRQSHEQSLVLKVGIIDLDGFKSVNDVYGHAAGDALLVQAATRLANALPDDAYLGRLGGDEFGVCLFMTPGDPFCIGAGICAHLNQPFQLEDAFVRVGGSAGFTTARPTDSEISNLLERADFALYKSKADSKGQATTFSDEDEHIVERKRQIKRHLLSGDLFNELDVVFQPIVFPGSGDVKAMETLVRWNNPKLGNIPPSEFIPIAEQIGRISDISCYVLRRALAAASEWPDRIFVSMNLSAVDLSSQPSVDRLLAILEASSVPAERVVLEITESTLMRDHEQGCERLESFRRLGVQVALDDFGTGYSSLSYLKRLAIRKLKIDRSFITDIETDDMARNLLTGILELCAGIGIDCVVEGVEQKGQLEIVAAHKNALAQGFFFSKPLAQSDALAYISRPSDNKRLRLIAS